MYHGLYRMAIQLINENSIIMVNKGCNHFIHGIAEKKRFVIEIYFDVHAEGRGFNKPVIVLSYSKSAEAHEGQKGIAGRTYEPGMSSYGFHRLTLSYE